MLPGEGRLLDLGCGRGILLSLLVTARERYDRGLYPEGWAPPPALRLHGIEGGEKPASAARQALEEEAEIVTADLRDADFPAADAVLLLDVLHYLPAAGQEELLARAAAALEPGGLLLIRDADAAAGWRFTATRVPGAAHRPGAPALAPALPLPERGGVAGNAGVSRPRGRGPADVHGHAVRQRPPRGARTSHSQAVIIFPFVKKKPWAATY